MNYPDIYFEPFWGRLNAQLEENGRYDQFVFKNDKGSVYYHFICRPVEYLVDGIQYFDTITPYGFNGPIILECEADQRQALVQDFNAAFDEYCLDNRLIAEYIRFSPWLKNHEDFKSIYTLKDNNQTYGVDLTCSDFFMDEFQHRGRKSVRKARKSGVTVQFDFEKKSVKDFMRLYNMMAEKNQIDDTYRFSEDYINQTLDYCQQNAFFANAYYDGKMITSELNLQSDRFIHGHLLGNDYEYSSLCSNHLLIYELCQWGVEHGKEALHIGGASKDSLIQYKLQYTNKAIYDFYIGKKIRNQAVYDQLIKISGKNNPDYFPSYR